MEETKALLRHYLNNMGVDDDEEDFEEEDLEYMVKKILKDTQKPGCEEGLDKQGMVELIKKYTFPFFKALESPSLHLGSTGKLRKQQSQSTKKRSSRKEYSMRSSLRKSVNGISKSFRINSIKSRE